MTLNDSEPITPLQSQTIKAALAAIVLNTVTLITVFTGRTFDIEAIQEMVDFGIPMAVNFLSIYFGWKAIKGRMKATHMITMEKNQ